MNVQRAAELGRQDTAQVRPQQRAADEHVHRGERVRGLPARDALCERDLEADARAGEQLGGHPRRSGHPAGGGYERVVADHFVTSPLGAAITASSSAGSKSRMSSFNTVGCRRPSA